jgi:hypothetical protein
MFASVNFITILIVVIYVMLQLVKQHLDVIISEEYVNNLVLEQRYNRQDHEKLLIFRS